ncbi:MAG: NAD(P)H-hydrate epimerase [Tissierellia bacterium]|nr:NAD(P)H-hydrate epimerase [Tissierellia bacterium]
MNEKTINKRQMAEIISYTRTSLGFSLDLIMESAAHALVSSLDLERRETFAFVCGFGFKAGIAFKAARILLAKGKKVYVFLALAREKLADYKMDLDLIENLDGEIVELVTIEDLGDFPNKLNKVNTIIDAIMDIDYDDHFFGSFDYIIESINRSRIYTISIDTPSGLDADSGAVNTACVQADLIIAQQFLKEGIIKTNKLIGSKVLIQDIGLPKKAIEKVLK